MKPFDSVAPASFNDAASMEYLRGKFIVLDGPEGCGKSTQIKLLAEKLRASAVPLALVRDPGTTRIGEQIRAILLNPDHVDMGMRCEMLLYMAARAQMMKQLIAPALDAGQCVLCDRFVSSTLAYQLGGDGLSADEIRRTADIAIAGRWPDLTIILDISPELSFQRIDRAKDRLEQRPMDYHRQVHANYLSQARHDPKRYAIVNADQPIAQVAADILLSPRPAGLRACRRASLSRETIAADMIDEQMTRFSPAIIVLILCAAAFLSGCRPSSANIKLRKERDQLQSRVQELETLRQGDIARIKALESQEGQPAMVAQDSLERLYTAHGLSFGRLTGGYRENDNDAHDSGVVVHVVPIDQEGQTLKAAGSFGISVFDLSVPEKPLVAQRQFTLEQAREAWNGRAMLFNYVLKVPFQATPKNPKLMVRVEFTDALTGRVLVGEKEVTVQP